MAHILLARAGLTALVSIQAVATTAIDLNRTHAGNPRWLGHARFHVSWQVANLLVYSVVALWLVWGTGPYPQGRFLLALAITAAPCVGFVMAQCMEPLFGSTLSDPNGMPPVRVRAGRRILLLDGNAIAVYLALVTLGVILWLYQG